MSLSTEARALAPASGLQGRACVSTRANASCARGHGRSAGHSRRRRTMRGVTFGRRRGPPRKHRQERRNGRRRARADGRNADDYWLPLVVSRGARVLAARQAAGRVCAPGRARVRCPRRTGRGARGRHRASAAVCRPGAAPHAALAPLTPASPPPESSPGFRVCGEVYSRPADFLRYKHLFICTVAILRRLRFTSCSGATIAPANHTASPKSSEMRSQRNLSRSANSTHHAEHARPPRPVLRGR